MHLVQKKVLVLKVTILFTMSKQYYTFVSQADKQTDSDCYAVGRLVDMNGYDALKRVYSTEYCSPTIPTSTSGNSTPKIIIKEEDNTMRVRRLTPRECFALQGFTKEDADMLHDNGLSDTQLYKQAGNTICVSVLTALFSSMKEQGLFNFA